MNNETLRDAAVGVLEIATQLLVEGTTREAQALIEISIRLLHMIRS